MWLYIALGLVVLAYYVIKSFKYDYWEKKGIPTASGNEWFFGHFKPIMLLKKHMTEVYDAMYKEFPNAPLIGFYMMNVPSLVVKDLDIIKTILLSEFPSFNFNGLTVSRLFTDEYMAGQVFIFILDLYEAGSNAISLLSYMPIDVHCWTHIKAAIIKIVDNFKLKPSPKTKYPFEMDLHFVLTLRPKGAVWVIFEPIDH